MTGRAPALTSSERALLVIGTDAEVAVALRERLDRAYVTVCDVEPGGGPAAIAACAPWPWMVVGTTPDIGAALLGALRHRPILLLWLGPAPAALPRHRRAFERFTALAAAAAAGLAAEVAGIRLSIGSGVLLPGGIQRANPELEALVSSHPHPFALPLSRFRSAQGVLRRAGIGWEAVSTSVGVALQPSGAA